jgi:hypothetical protein
VWRRKGSFGSLDLVKHLRIIGEETERLEALTPEEFNRELEAAMKQKYRPFDPRKTALMLTYRKRSEQAEEERTKAQEEREKQEEEQKQGNLH